VSLLLLAAGCSGPGTVSGKVSYKGKALPGGTVLFIHEQKGSFSCKIQGDGSYSIADVPAGTVRIAVTPPWSASDTHGGRVALAKAGKGFTQEQLEKMKQSMPGVDEKDLKNMMGIREAQERPSELIPPQYGDPDKSGLRYTVKSGSHTFDITLD
jgi:hypothetical protein